MPLFTFFRRRKKQLAASSKAPPPSPPPTYVPPVHPPAPPSLIDRAPTPNSSPTPPPKPSFTTPTRPTHAPPPAKPTYAPPSRVPSPSQLSPPPSIRPIPLGRAARRTHRNGTTSFPPSTPSAPGLTRAQLRPPSPKLTPTSQKPAPRPKAARPSSPRASQVPRLASLPAPNALPDPIRGQSFAVSAEAFVASEDIPEERSNAYYVREMLFEGLFILFMIALVLTVAYFLVYYIGYGPTLEKNGLDFFHQWFS